MRQLILSDLRLIFGGTGPAGGTVVPKDSPRGEDKVDQTKSADGSYQPATLPIEPDEG
ncbi:hypothetical protein [Pseudoalteromonas phenolica]|uniref:Uncharacterized protein n=1 Tax=Pseudoalteromonas phenolica TaxID=161398 RepID=A0A0S2K7H4_9GAMM|nr:hypothetical protein [Pseudoalteromonas phenolica]ALO43988.1 hypothetical protein PP2015_3514 [Pseudoalteromonas phenolica]MBE0356963.1 hypothetical protein [Pseudoalteromonas phenolica O-BC30]